MRTSSRSNMMGSSGTGYEVGSTKNGDWIRFSAGGLSAGFLDG